MPAVPVSGSGGQKDVINYSSIATANTNLDGTGTLGTLVTAGDYGSILKSIDICAIATTAAGMIRIFINDGGLNYWLIDEVPVTAITVNSTTEAFKATWTPPSTFNNVFGSAASGGLLLPAAYVVKAGTTQAVTFNLTTKSVDL